jgi:hypothetical protein
MIDLIKLLKEIEKAGKHEYRFFQLSLKNDKDFQIDSLNDLLKDSSKAIKWFCGVTFYTGRNDFLSETYKRAFFKAFSYHFSNDIDGEKIKNKIDSLLNKFQDEVSKIKTKKGLPYKIRRRDQEAIKNVLGFVANNLKEYDFNPIKYLKEKIENHKVRDFIEKVSIKHVGLKIKSLMIREVTVFYDLKIADEELIFAFPVDAWVRKLCSVIWPETKNMDDKELVKYVILELKKHKISPIYFNAALWGIGWHGRNAIELLLERVKQL